MKANSKDTASKYLMYKDRPIVRCGDVVYYGNLTDSHIIVFKILQTEKVKDLDVPVKVSVQLQSTDPSVKSKDRVVKQIEKDGFFDAMDIGLIWLERALAST